MTALLWILLPVIVAAGSALLSFCIMQAKLEVAVARERESVAEAQAALRNSDKLLEEKVRAAEETAANRALDHFLGDLRVEERQYIRENRSSLACRKSLVLQERLYFRNIPLSNWIEHEMLVENNGDPHSLARQTSVFNPQGLSQNGAAQRSHFLPQPSRAARTA